MKTVVFDLDGTVLDTCADIALACNTVLARRGYPQHPLAAYRQMVGNGFDVLVRRAVPADENMSQRLLAEIAKEARACYAEQMLERTRPYPGIPEALRHLQACGITLALLSNKPDAMTTTLISHFFPEIHFAKVQGALPDLPLKPDPAALLAMLKELEAPLATACYVGDSNVDMLTARNAQIYAVGVAWGFRGIAELESAGADLIARQPDDLGKLASALM